MTMRGNGGDRKERGRVNDPMDRTKDVRAKRREVREPAPVWTPTRATQDMSREAVDERLASHLAEMEEKQAPDLAFVILEGAAGAVCDYMAWEGEIRVQGFEEE